MRQIEKMEPEALQKRSRALLGSREFVRARTFIVADDTRTLTQQRELTQIPAPPFGEGPRADRMVELMEDAGLDRTGKDDAGNRARLVGSEPGDPVDRIGPSGHGLPRGYGRAGTAAGQPPRRARNLRRRARAGSSARTRSRLLSHGPGARSAPSCSPRPRARKGRVTSAARATCFGRGERPARRVLSSRWMVRV